MKKCIWALSSPLEEIYHDQEWGTPVRDDRLLFEFLILEGAQAGLSWATILKKRDGYRQAFDNFDATLVAGYDENKIQALLINPGIIRNRLKINAAVSNAKAFLQVQQEFGSFAHYIWRFVNDEPIQNSWQQHADIPASTRSSEIMSNDLKKRGFKFVGSTICYALMQAVGMVNDHTVDCFRHAQLKKLAEKAESGVSLDGLTRSW
ncbi:MAG: DNA-3-methyladenine glycosylase I [Methylococcales bacterium]